MKLCIQICFVSKKDNTVITLTTITKTHINNKITKTHINNKITKCKQNTDPLTIQKVMQATHTSLNGISMNRKIYRTYL